MLPHYIHNVQPKQVWKIIGANGGKMLSLINLSTHILWPGSTCIMQVRWPVDIASFMNDADSPRSLLHDMIVMRAHRECTGRYLYHTGLGAWSHSGCLGGVYYVHWKIYVQRRILFISMKSSCIRYTCTCKLSSFNCTHGWYSSINLRLMSRIV